MKNNAPTPLEAIQMECAALAHEIQDMGLGFQIDPRAIQLKALVRILIAAGIITEDEWELAVATVQRDILSAALLQAPEAKRQAMGQKARDQLVLPDHVKAIRDRQH